MTSHDANSDPLAHSLSWRRLFLRRAKLKASSRTSALMSGFAMVAMVELNVEKDVPEVLLVTFSVVTTLLISIHVFALMISTCILPNLESIAQVLPHHSAITESPHERMHTYIEMAWIFSTGLGTLLLLAEIAVISWVKFYLYSKAAAIASTAVLVPVCILFLVFAMHFYNSLVKHKYECSTRGIQELQLIAKHLQSPNPIIGGTQHV